MTKSGQAITIIFPVQNPSTGAAANADTLPTGTLYVNGVANAASVTVANITTGLYSAAVTLPTLSAGDIVSLKIAATQSTIVGVGVIWQDVADTKIVSDLHDSAYAGGAVASVTGAVGSVTGNVGGNVVGSVGSLTGYTTPPTAVAIRTEIDSNSTQLATLVARNNPLDAAGIRTAIGLASANMDTQLSGLPLAVWNVLAATITVANSIGVFLKGLGVDTSGVTTLLTRITGAVLLASAYTAPDNADIATILTRTDVATSTRLAASSYTAPPTTAAIDAAVWADTAAYGAGSKGAELAAAGSASDPLLNPVPGSYASGTAGFALGKIANTTISVTAPIGANSALTLVVGDDYKAVDGRSIDVTSATWPSLASAAIAFHAKTQTGIVTVAGSPLNASTVRIELTATNTIAIGAGNMTYDIRATLSNGDVVTLMSGNLIMRPTSTT